jgi:transcriptional regulator GlxA family with amidase domain
VQLAFVLYEGLTALDLIGPLEVLARIPGSTCQLVAAQHGLVTSDTGLVRLAATGTLDEVSRPDVIVVPGGLAGTHQAMRDEQLLDWLRAAAPHTRWLTSVCTGSLILAAAGLLQGRRATTHWVALEELRTFGAIPTNERIVIDGDLVTAAGVSAGIDMALSLTARLRGQQLAKMIQLAIEYDPQPPFDAGSTRSAGRLTTAAARVALQREFRRPVPAPTRWLAHAEG